MTLRTARRLTIGFLVLYTVALTFPGILPFNRIRPFVLGLPFAIFWVALWVALSGLVFMSLRRTEASRED